MFEKNLTLRSIHNLLGQVMIMFGIGFFVFSMLAWRGFWLVDKDSLCPWFWTLTEEEFTSIFWWNYVVLALTIISLIVGLLGFVVYVMIEDLPTENREKNED